MNDNLMYGNATCGNFSSVEAEKFLALSAKLGEARRLNMELLNRAGSKFPDSERFVSDQSVIAYLRAWQTRYREGSAVYNAISDIVRGIGDSREIPTAAYIRRGEWKKTESGSVYCGTCGHHVEWEAGNFCPNCGSCMNNDITDVCSRYNG